MRYIADDDYGELEVRYINRGANSRYYDDADADVQRTNLKLETT